MKTIFLLFVTAIWLLNCNQSSKAKNGFNHKISIEDSLMGDWNICKTIEGESTTNYNVCPKISFFPNKVGQLILANSSICHFKWSLANQTLSFSFDSKEAKQMFLTKESVFKISIQVQGKFEFLELKQLDDKYSILLSREKIKIKSNY